MKVSLLINNIIACLEYIREFTFLSPITNSLSRKQNIRSIQKSIIFLYGGNKLETESLKNISFTTASKK